MNVINLQDRRLALLRRRAAAFGLDIVKEEAGTWALVSPGLRPELSGVTLAAISADLDVLDEQAQEPNGDFILG